MPETQDRAELKISFARDLPVAPMEAGSTAPRERDRGAGGTGVWEKTDKGNYYPIHNTIPTLPSRRFNLGWSANQGSLFLASTRSVNDKLYPSGMVEVVLKEVQDFWARRARYNKLGLVWRRNILLFGPPGTGKTLILEAVARYFSENEGFVANYGGGLPCGLGGALQIIRGIEPERPILVTIEDLDQMVQTSPSIEADLLQFLDGATKAENVVTIATTNYPKRLGERLLRPGRFDLLIDVPQPDTATKIGYLRAFDPDYFTDARMAEWLDATQGLTFAALKEVVLQVLVYDRDVKTAARSMRPDERKTTSAAVGNERVGHYQ